jgi:magnesium-transporting ATPase (P-type)
MKETSVEDVLSGDIIEVGEGHQVPSDCRIIPIKSITLAINLTSFIRESQSIE